MSIFDTSSGDDSHTREAAKQSELIKLIGTRMISRKDVMAVEKNDGTWRPAERNGQRVGFSLDAFKKHLSGEVTLGHYLLGTDDTCKYFVFDIDLDPEGTYLDLNEDTGLADRVLAGGVKCNPREVWRDPTHPGHPWYTLQLRALSEGLAVMVNRTLGIPVAIMNSGGKGIHVYGFCGSRPAEVVRKLALGALNHLDCFEPIRGENFFKHRFGQYRDITIEVFPKQGSLEGKDLGNLVRLPLGINRKTNLRSYFVSCKAGMLLLPEMDPTRALQGDLPWE